MVTHLSYCWALVILSYSEHTWSTYCSNQIKSNFNKGWQNNKEHVTNDIRWSKYFDKKLHRRRTWTAFPILTMGRSFPLKIAPSHGGSGPHLIHGSLGPPETQRASRSVQQFLQVSRLWQTDSALDMFLTITALYKSATYLLIPTYLQTDRQTTLHRYIGNNRLFDIVTPRILIDSTRLLLGDHSSGW